MSFKTHIAEGRTLIDLDEIVFLEKYGQAIVSTFNGEDELSSYAFFKTEDVWENIIEEVPGYLYHSEAKLLREKAQEIVKPIKFRKGEYVTWIDLGTGSGVADKTIPLIEAYKDQNKENDQKITCVAWDIATKFLSGAKIKLGSNGIKHSIEKSDFYSKRARTPYPNPILLMTGITIGNSHKVEVIKERLEILKKLAGQRAFAIITYGTCKNKTLLESQEMYGHPRFKDWIYKVLETVSKTFSSKTLDASAEAFEVSFQYNEQEGCVSANAHALKTQEIKIKGHTITIKEGQTYPLMKSYRFTPEEFAQIAQKAGWTTEATFENGYTAIQVMKSQEDRQEINGIEYNRRQIDQEIARSAKQQGIRTDPPIISSPEEIKASIQREQRS